MPRVAVGRGVALREGDGAIGQPPARVTVIGAADRYRTITGFEVTPIVGVVPPDLVLTPHEAEVAEVFEVPLAFLLDGANHVEASVEWQGRDRHYYEISWDGHRIWGATRSEEHTSELQTLMRLSYA